MSISQYIQNMLLRWKYNERVSFIPNARKPWAICTYSAYDYHSPHNIIGQFSHARDAFIRAKQIQQAYIQKYGRFKVITHYMIQQHNPPTEPKYSPAANHLWIRNTTMPLHRLNITDIFLVAGKYHQLPPNHQHISHDDIILSAIEFSPLYIYTITYQQYIVPLDICITYEIKYSHQDPDPICRFMRNQYIYYTISAITSDHTYDSNTLPTHHIPHLSNILQAHILNQSSLSEHQKIQRLHILNRVNFPKILQQIPHIYTIPNTQPITH